MVELDRLVEVTANLQAHIDDQAKAIAGPLIVQAKRRADRRIAEVQVELRYQADLVEELRRQLKPLDRMGERTKQATFSARGLDCHRCEALIVGVEPGSTLTEVMTAYAHHACGVDRD